MVVDGECLQPAVAADPMVDVHHGGSRRQLDQVLDDQVRVDGPSPRTLGGGFATVAEDLRLRDDGNVVEPEAALYGGDGDAQRGVAVGKGGEVRDIGPWQAFAAQELVEVHLASRSLRSQQDACRRVCGETAQPCRRVARAVVGGQVGQFPATEVDAMASPRGGRVQACATVPLDMRIELSGRQETAHPVAGSAAPRRSATTRSGRRHRRGAAWWTPAPRPPG